MEITATFFSSAQLQRKASIKSDTDLHFGAFGVRASYKSTRHEVCWSQWKKYLPLTSKIFWSGFHPYKNSVLFQCEMDWWNSGRAPPFHQQALSRAGACSITVSLCEARTTDFLNHFNLNHFNLNHFHWNLGCCKLKSLRAVSGCGRVLAL